MSAPVLGVIPARLGSSRLPRKPLLRIAGRPLVEWVWRRAVGMELFTAVVVATDSDEVAGAAREFGARVELTDPAHPSGTDRVAEVARRGSYAGFPVVVNVQGDEPFLSPDHVEAAVRLVQGGEWEVGTVAAPIASLEEWRDPAVVKVVRGRDGAALYFSRAPIPHPRDDADAGPGAEEEVHRSLFLRHVGLYAYRRDALLRWVALPEGELERVERLEQLRPLAAGMRIGVAVGAPAERGVDTPADAERAERRLSTEPFARERALV
ncbi:MAG TPA: 3-deoxy-manno-octulosonate cytidylyltransferase [Longimicrobiaceae bacterium]|nr:3-deoxy-manno-octulosonate cytidylyltransferase [Longimicrobiaceae bacterium]